MQPSPLISYLIVVVEYIAALRTELRRIMRILRLPAALVTSVKRCTFGLLSSALLTELTLIYRAT